MYKFDKILIGLDLTEIDEQLIEAACKICQLSGTAEIFFINVIPGLNLPDHILKEFPDITEKAINERKLQLEEEINRKFSCEGVTPHVVIREGQPTKEIMKFATQNKTDLIILGRKNQVKGGGVLIQRLARRAGCSLLVIPKGITMDMERILVPIDFSSYSKMALEKAVSLSQRLELKPEVVAQNVYHVPSGYHYTGKTYEEFAEVMKDHAKKDYSKFIKGIELDDIKLKDIYTLSQDEHIISSIYKQAKKSKASLIIIGAKGRSSTTAIFIGSKAEKMVQLDTDVPLMIVRPKGKRAGFMEYLQEL